MSITMPTAQNMTDWGKMQSANMQVLQPKTVEELQEIIRHAADNKLKVSIRGAGHSAGGQSLVQDGIMVDINGLNRILEVDETNKLVHVECGVIWGQLTKVLEPLRLSVTTKQEFDIFTIGGSLSCNVHGKTVDYGPLIENTRSIRILLANGEIVEASRDENFELFRAAIGGYGLVGIIVDATLEVVPDRIVQKAEVTIANLDLLVERYLNRIKPRDLPLCYGFLSADCSRGYYLSYEYLDTQQNYTLDQLKREETNPLVFNLFVWLIKTFNFRAKKVFKFLWFTSPEPEITLRSRRLLLWDDSPQAFKDSLLLQKYFVPMENFTSFAKKVGSILGKYSELKILTNHFRFVPGNQDSCLPYTPQDSICLIPCYIIKRNQSWQKQFEAATQELLDAVIAEGGRYYLTFDLLPSPKQFAQAYPEGREFFALKKKYDPDEIFQNFLYQKYVQ